MNWHLLTLTEISQLLDTSVSGLSSVDALQHLNENGKNEIEDIKKKTILEMVLHQLTDFMILILISTAVISGVIDDVTNTIIILVIIVLNAIVDFVQEYIAEKLIDIPSNYIVIGDTVAFEAGNNIPADVRFFETYHIKVD